jgi:hypothetical protein
MYLCCYTRKKNGKRHRYWSVVESRRVAGGKTAQQQVLYLGEINDSQQAAWRKTLEVCDPQKRRTCQLSLFPSDRPIPPDAVNAVSVDLARMAVRRPRRFGDCWLGLMRWRELGLEGFWGRALGRDRGAVDGSKVLMDRGVPKEEDLARMRADGVGYVVGTPKSLLDRLSPGLADRPWEEVHEGMRVKLAREGQELYVLAQSEDRRKKENAIRRRKLKTLVHGLNRLKRTCRDRDRLIGKVAVLRKEAGRAARFVHLRKPRPDEPVNRETFVGTFDRVA